MSFRLADVKQVITSLIKGKKPEELLPTVGQELLDEAKREIAKAAVWDRDAQRGLAILQLRELYTRNVKAKDNSRALSVRKELNLSLIHISLRVREF